MSPCDGDKLDNILRFFAKTIPKSRPRFGDPSGNLAFGESARAIPPDPHKKMGAAKTTPIHIRLLMQLRKQQNNQVGRHYANSEATEPFS